MSIMEIIFANFWTWAGTVALVATLGRPGERDRGHAQAGRLAPDQLFRRHQHRADRQRHGGGWTGPCAPSTEQKQAGGLADEAEKGRGAAATQMRSACSTVWTATEL